jgi:hypothetical protein
MAGRSGINESVAYKALSASGSQVLRVIEQRARHGGAAITLGQIMEAGMCRSSARSGVRQCEALGFIVVGLGPRRVGEFELTDGWRNVVDVREAKRLVKASKAQRQSRTPATVEPVEVETVEEVVEAVEIEQPPPVMRQPSLPALRWLDGR